MSEIKNHIQGITGVGAANDDFIESAQRFAASKIPKELMLWAITETVPGTHGGNNSNQQITLPIKTDSLLFVRRDQFEAQKVDGSMRGFIGNSNSLNLATNTFPKYYIADGNRVIIKPDPDDTYTGHAQYVDYTKINEDSDLRNAVVYHSASSEFEKLASSKVSDWTDLVPPIAPSAPDFGSDLTIGAVAPVAPSSPSFTYTNVSVNDMVQPLISVTDMSSASGAPTYTKPVMSLSTLSSIGDLSISAVSPVTPSISAASVTITGTAPTYTSPVMSLTTFPTITWTFPSVPVAPSTSAQTVATFGNVPLFNPPTMRDLEFGGDADGTDSQSWILQEDSEMLAARISVIQSKIGEFSAKLSESQNEFNKSNAIFQADVQEKIQEAQLSDAEESRKLQKYQSELQSYQGEVNKVVSGNQAEIAEWQTRSATDIQKYGADIQNALNNFNKENVVYQQDIAKKTQNLQKDIQEAVQNAQNDFNNKKSNLDKDVQIGLQNAINNFQEDVQEYSASIQKFNSELTKYQNDTNKEVQDYTNTLNKNTQEYQNKIALYGAELQKFQAEVGEKSAKVGSATQNAAYYSAEAKKYYEWANMEISSYIQNNSKMINRTIAAQSAAQQRR